MLLSITCITGSSSSVLGGLKSISQLLITQVAVKVDRESVTKHILAIGVKQDVMVEVFAIFYGDIGVIFRGL
jgi:hypothetical protein